MEILSVLFTIGRGTAIPIAKLRELPGLEQAPLPSGELLANRCGHITAIPLRQALAEGLKILDRPSNVQHLIDVSSAREKNASDRRPRIPEALAHTVREVQALRLLTHISKEPKVSACATQLGALMESAWVSSGIVREAQAWTACTPGPFV